MNPLVIELQQKAIDTNVKINDLLRLAKILSAKLNLKELEEWIDLETNGYFNNEIPSYRELSGVPKFFNPFYRGGPQKSDRGLRCSRRHLEVHRDGETEPLFG